MKLWLVVVCLFILSSFVSSFTLVETCSGMKPDQCGQGVCPEGSSCEYRLYLSHPGGYCACIEVPTTTLQRCTVNQKTRECGGYCEKGMECLDYYGKCLCQSPTTTTLQECAVNRKTGACEGYCGKGSICTDEYGKCGCYVPTTTTVENLAYTTTTVHVTTTLHYATTPTIPNVAELLSRITTTTLSILHTQATIHMFPDMDHDGVPDSTDNCVNVSNANQFDLDYDGVGDACDACQCISCGDAVDPNYMYEFSDKYGCGCDDSDGGHNKFVKGTIDRAPPPGGDSVEVPPSAGEMKGYLPSELTDSGAKTAMAATKPAASGTTSDYNPRHYTDFCKDASTLVEYYCDVNGLHSEELSCVNGCEDGKCRCAELGDGDKPFRSTPSDGDYCMSSSILVEKYHYGNASAGVCQLKDKNYYCIMGCSGSKCNCGETDNGVNTTVKGTTALNHTDFCHANGKLMEYYITVSNSTDCRDATQEITCPTGYTCRDGACKPASCLNGVRDGNEVGVDCGGTWCPPCSPCATGAKWAPTDGPCTQKWPTSQGPSITGNTEMDSCALYEVCDNNLDFIVTDALRCCENVDYGSVLTAPRKSSKEGSCNWARRMSGVNSSLNPTNFKKCLAIYSASAFGYSAVYMQGYFHGEWCCYGSGDFCPDSCPNYQVKPAAWEMGTSASCDGDGGAHPDFHMGGHRCEYHYVGICSIACTKWGKAGYWSSDTDYTRNSDSVVDVPAHASILKLSTGTCVDYSVAMTTILRKLGYDKDSVYSVDGEGHWYNLIKFPGETKWHYLDTVGNRGSEIMGGASWPNIINWSDPARHALTYDYCRKMDRGCSNDQYGVSLGRCPDNNHIYGCEGIPR